MKVFETLTVSGKEYSLKFTMGDMVKLEAKLGCDIMTGMGKITSLTTLAEYYFAALRPFNDDIRSVEAVYMIFDEYITQGGTYEELQQKIIEVLVLSGVMSQKQYEFSKKAAEKQQAAIEKLLTETGDALSV